MDKKNIAIIILGIIVIGLLFYITISILNTRVYQQGYNQGQTDITRRIRATDELPDFIIDEETNLTYITWKQFGQYCLDNVCGSVR